MIIFGTMINNLCLLTIRLQK